MRFAKERTNRTNKLRFLPKFSSSHSLVESLTMSTATIFHVVLVVLLTSINFSNSLLSVSRKSDYYQTIVLSGNKIEDPLIENNASVSDSGSIESPLVKELKLEPNFIDFHNDGVQAYLSNDWESCINHFERSLNLYRRYTESLANCRVQCEFERVKAKNTYPEDYDNIHFYEKLIVKTLCLEKCRQKTLSYLPRHFSMEPELYKLYKTRKPYEYLQLCYYKEGEIEKAISATYTALVGNPGDELMKKNIEYYIKQKDFNWDLVQDLEDKRYSPYYQDAVDKYQNKEWTGAIELFEISVDIWLQEHDKCRELCEKEFDQGWLPDFTASVANHFVYVLRCKQNCTNELSFVNGRFYDDLFPSMYNYLQFAYYSADKLLEASRCAASYLMLVPHHEEMLANVEYYKSKQPEKMKDYLKPRPEAEKFLKRKIYEEQLLGFIDAEFLKLASEPFRSNPEMDHLTDREIDDVTNANVTISNDVK